MHVVPVRRVPVVTRLARTPRRRFAVLRAGRVTVAAPSDGAALAVSRARRRELGVEVDGPVGSLARVPATDFSSKLTYTTRSDGRTRCDEVA